MLPRVKIIGFSDDLSENELISALKTQNKFLADKNVKLVKKYCDDNKLYNKYMAVIEVDTATFRFLMDARKVFIGWDSCKVVEYFGILRCFKCCGFGHRMKDCKSENFVCGLCSESHHHKECKSEIVKCNNCLKIKN